MPKKELTPVELFDKARASFHILGGLGVVTSIVLMLAELIDANPGVILLFLAAFVYTLGDVLKAVVKFLEEQKPKAD